MSARYEFIDAEKDNYPIRQMCEWAGVSKSGFYDWRDRPASATARRRTDLKVLILATFDDADGTYGHRRTHAALLRSGHACSPELVRQLMRELGLQPCQPRPWRPTTTVAGAAPAPDLVGRDFIAEAPGTKLVGDITYIRTWAGWLYLATVIDCHTKACIGYAMADHLRTELVIDALAMAARNYSLADGTIFHSDRGTQGGLNRSSQHLTIAEVSDGATAAAGGSGFATGDAFAGPPDSGSSCGARVLAPDREGKAQRGRCTGGRRVSAGRRTLVSSRWRDAAAEPG